MKRLLLAVVAASSGLAAHAQSTAPVYVFTTVDAVQTDVNVLWVTGIVEGETAPQEYPFYFEGVSSPTSPAAGVSQRESCERMLLLAMAKPGQYRVRVQNDSYTYWYSKCTLERVAP